jgi:predicted component of type VI protein secretion system
LPAPIPPPAAPSLEDDVEATRIIARHPEGERFVLQFSTGESFTVFGSGLIGRSPRPEPGEYFDQLVRVLDPSRSVSKTHLEFGQEAGSFWVKDRYSGNGTIVREPESKPIRCHPERRYRLVRGSRVDLGEQFFIVS